MRRAAQTELPRIGAPVVGRVLPLIGSDDTEVRREILRALVGHGKRALGFVPDLEAADGMPAARELLPGLADVAELGSREDVHRAVTAAARADRRLQWHGTESIVLRGLRNPARVVRGKAVHACDELAAFTPKIVATVETLADDREVATAMAWFLPGVRRLGRRAELMVPMLAGIVKRGRSSGLIWGGHRADVAVMATGAHGLDRRPVMRGKACRCGPSTSGAGVRSTSRR